MLFSTIDNGDMFFSGLISRDLLNKLPSDTFLSLQTDDISLAEKMLIVATMLEQAEKVVDPDASI